MPIRGRPRVDAQRCGHLRLGHQPQFGSGESPREEVVDGGDGEVDVPREQSRELLGAPRGAACFEVDVVEQPELSREDERHRRDEMAFLEQSANIDRSSTCA